MEMDRRHQRALSSRFNQPRPLALLPAALISDLLLRMEVTMIAKIIIKRRFVKENTPQILSLLNKIRSIAMNQPGYISGETLMQMNYPENLAVICTWQKMKYWEAWKSSEERKTYEAMLEIYQTRPTQYEEYLLGTSFQKEE
jgi:heme-degrading monooxygenase HmoA